MYPELPLTGLLVRGSSGYILVTKKDRINTGGSASDLKVREEPPTFQQVMVYGGGGTKPQSLARESLT
jgi:hypothetical protein